MYEKFYVLIVQDKMSPPEGGLNIKDDYIGILKRNVILLR